MTPLPHPRLAHRDDERIAECLAVSAACDARAGQGRQQMRQAVADLGAILSPDGARMERRQREGVGG